MPHPDQYDEFHWVIVAKAETGVLWYWDSWKKDWTRDPIEATGWARGTDAGDVLRSNPPNMVPHARVADIRYTAEQPEKFIVERIMSDQSVWYLKMSKARWTSGTRIRCTLVEWTSNINDAFNHDKWGEDDMKSMNSWLERLYGGSATIVRKRGE